MSHQPPQNFMDSKTLVALLLLGFVWIGWQSYLQQKYPDAYKASEEKNPTTEVDSNKAEAMTTSKGEAVAQSEKKVVEESRQSADEVEPLNQQEKVLNFASDKLEFELSSKGMSFNFFRVKDHFDRDGNPYTFQASRGTRILETRLLGRGRPLDFDLKEVGAGSYVGVAKLEGMTIKKSLEVDSASYLVKTKVSVENASDSFIGVETGVVLNLEKIETSSFLPTFERQEFFSLGSEGEERVLIDVSEQLKDTVPNIKVASIGTQYFSQSLVDNSKIAPEYSMSVLENGGTATGFLKYSAMNKDQFQLEYDAFIGPKYLSVLQKIDPDLASVIDFGFFSWLAKPMLQLLKLFNGLIGNWGFAIILLTIIVRMIVLPFTMMSYKSMNKMKLIQPRIKDLKEKYKDDAQSLNKEMMSLMKDNKVNPLGGCLPMLLQFPVFIALYQVLGQSVELYQAPFVFWIQDLSLKDPYYVLPVLMGVTMFVQQKITPNTMDPQQAKVMMFLPLVFVLFMVGLPSGLTLYIFVSSLFAILQQMFFMRETLVSNEIQTA